MEKKQKQQKSSNKDMKAYQKMLSDINLYDGEIDGIAGPITRKADSTFKELSKKGYSKSQMFRHTLGAPHMSDEEWTPFIGGTKGFEKPKIEDTVIDSMKKSY
jgi:hypothetical protein